MLLATLARVHRVLGPSVLLALALLLAGPIGPVDAEIQTLTGNYAYSWTDVRAADGSALAFARTYNSLDTRVGVLGPGWTHRFAVRLVRPTGRGPDDLMFVGPQGRQDLYTARDDGTWEPSPTAQGKLTRESWPLANGEQLVTYVLEQFDGTVYRFNGGQPYQITFPNRQGEVLLSFDRQGNLREVTNQGPTRGKLLFTYTDDGSRLLAVSDDLTPPRRVQFGYDDLGRLATVTNRVGQVTRYTYDGTTSHLHEVVDPRGHIAVSMTYDEAGHTLQQSNTRGLQEGKAITFAYEHRDDGSTRTTFVEPPSTFAPTAQTSIVDTYDTGGRITSRERSSAPGDDPLIETYGAAPGRPWGLISQAGGKTAPPLDGGQPVDEVTIPVGWMLPTPLRVRVGAQSPLPAIAPDRPNQLPRRQVDALKGRVAEKTTDQAGRMIGLVVPPGQGELAGTWRIEYDDEDQIVAIAGPAGRTTYTYDEVGNLIAVGEADGRSRQYEYDDRDSLSEFQDVDGATWRFAYDERYRLTEMSMSPPGGGDASTVDYQHDGLGRLRLVSERVGTAAPVVTELAYEGFVITGIWQR